MVIKPQFVQAFDGSCSVPVGGTPSDTTNANESPCDRSSREVNTRYPNGALLHRWIQKRWSRIAGLTIKSDLLIVAHTAVCLEVHREALI